jgi:predicted PurR-regulated permease PerM
MPEQQPDRPFLVLVLLVTVAFLAVILPFFGAVLWAVVAALLFSPLNDRLRARLNGRSTLAAVLTLLVLIGIVIIPALVIGALLIDQAAGLYAQLRAGEIDIASYFARVQHALPGWAATMLERSGLGDIEAVRNKVAAAAASSFQDIAGRALSIGQSAFSFLLALGVMLYLTFFLLRDGRDLAARFETALPLRHRQRRALIDTFAVVVRATVKGSLVVAVLQGAIGGIVFALLGIDGALLWGVTMAFFSLLPAIGSGIVWVPVALYLLVSGAIADGLILTFCGVFVIGMVDNVVRPILVGRDTKMPDYLIFITTLGGLSLFGFNGLVIGPVIAAMFLTVWQIYTRMDGETASQDGGLSGE